MELRSSAFSDGETIPRRFTCDGQDLSPPLDWSGAPAQVLSFAIFCDDPDAPDGTWHHRAAYDIPANRLGLAEGAAQHGDAIGFRQGVNNFRRTGYGGPCPPRGHGPHHYRFRILALSLARLPLGSNRSCADIERAARNHIIAEASLVGVYER
jgi:Raf kinase inhibitor-like YbhB/YbcL family protein